MSIDLNWETLTGGSDGTALAEQIRDFIHVKFQAVPLPRFIKSVTVHEFAFGEIPPSIVLKDICDPLPDFYAEDYESNEEDDAEGDDDDDDEDEGVPDAIRTAERKCRVEQRVQNGGEGGGMGRVPGSAGGTTTPFGEGFFSAHGYSAGLRTAPGTPDLSSPFLGLGVPAHGIPRGASKMHYWQSKLGPGWSGAQIPLAAVAGAQHLNGWLDTTSPSQSQSHPNYRTGSSLGHHHRNQSQSSVSVENFPASLAVPPHSLREKHSVSTLSPTSAEPPCSLNRDTPGGGGGGGGPSGSAVDDDHDNDIPRPHSKVQGAEGKGQGEGDDESARKFHHEPRPEDMQAVFRIHYAGDVRLELTAMILLDYPMPSFVGIPLKLNITGLTFDGVGVIAYIRKRVHFCFLSPEDAVAAVGDDDGDVDGAVSRTMDFHTSHGKRQSISSEYARSEDRPGSKGKGRVGGLLQEIRVESEIGQREGIKQSLKNVGKVEKFVLEQVRRIFEEEFVYPSFWTFLV